MSATQLENSAPPATHHVAKPTPIAKFNPTETPDADTLAIQQDTDLYRRVMTRLANPRPSVPAEDVLGPLDDAEE